MLFWRYFGPKSLDRNVGILDFLANSQLLQDRKGPREPSFTETAIPRPLSIDCSGGCTSELGIDARAQNGAVLPTHSLANPSGALDAVMPTAVEVPQRQR